MASERSSRLPPRFQRVKARTGKASNVLARKPIRIWFCLGVAAIAAAITDPIVEFASNAGWFGRGNFTDHSNLNVFPTLLLGSCFVAFYFIRQLRRMLAADRSSENLLRASNEALRGGIARFLPLTFAAQILILYLMEIAEQYVVWHHSLGGTIWLGGPPLISLVAHALACVFVAYATARAIRAFARTTLRIVRRMRALATLPARAQRTLSRRSSRLVTLRQIGPVLCRIGERAPPLLQS